MRRRLPPLNAIRAFEASGRHGSFTEAAKELNVTPGAISRHVRLLEDFLQVHLFERSNKKLTITREGSEYLPEIQRSLDRISSATKQLTGRRGKTGLSVRILPTLAIRWFIPHFPTFQAKHPEIRVSISTSIEPPNFEKEDVDLGITRFVARGPRIRSELFALEELLLVGSPALLQTIREANSLERLSTLTWLVADSRPDTWQSWLEGVGLPDLLSTNVQHFEQLNMTLQAAVAGLGVTVVPKLFVGDDLAAGHLVVLDKPVVSSQRYYLTYPDAKADVPSLKKFRDWLLAEVRESKLNR